MIQPYRLTEDVLTINGVEIITDLPGNYEIYKDRDDVLYMAKGSTHLQAYADLAATFGPVRHLVEIGVFRGGSTAFFHQFLNRPRMICIERNEIPVPKLEAYRAKHDGVEIHYGIDQADRSAPRGIMPRVGSQIDWVIDDASHQYEPSRASFEAIFPFVRPGGLYIVEDSACSHSLDAQKPDHYWAKQPALTNLILDFVVATMTNVGAFNEVHAGGGCCWVRRGHATLPTDGSFRLDDHMLTRGRARGLI
jgi:predicted O-methyltransferase YrrM